MQPSAARTVTRATAETTLARYLATRLLGSWVTYQGEGLRSVLASLASAYGLAVLALAQKRPRARNNGSIDLSTPGVGLAPPPPPRPRPVGFAGAVRRKQTADSAALIAIVAGATTVLDEMEWPGSESRPGQRDRS